VYSGFCTVAGRSNETGAQPPLVGASAVGNGGVFINVSEIPERPAVG
jgi:hypothetical protein